MDKIKINIFDDNFNHAHCSTWWKKSVHVDYVKRQNVFDGITVFTDNFLFRKEIVQSVKSKYKVGWILEPRSVFTNVNEVIKYENLFDFILTNDSFLLDRDKYKFVPANGCWIDFKDYAVYDKSKNISMIASTKTGLDGHKLRHIIYKSIKNIDYYGSICNRPIKEKIFGLKDYRFSVAIENCSIKNYFTEKIFDCFACGCIPIYYGCSNIEDYFNIDGIVRIQSFNELKNILPSLNNNYYFSKINAIKENLELCKQYDTTEDWLYKNVYNKLEEI